MKRIIRSYIFCISILLLWCCSTIPVVSQDLTRKIQLNVYGAFDFTVNRPTGKYNTFFTLGEQDFFVTARINDRISFLGESVVRFDSKTGTSFSSSIERAQLKYDFSNSGNHSLVVGKMHSPVNYWNDVYHHGRLFFPTIDRPISFSHVVPLHSLGIRLQGQNIGPANFGYDVMVGNGISSTDAGAVGTDMAYMASVHVKPKDGMRIQAAVYNEHLEKNVSGVHSGHSQSSNNYKGALDFRLYTFSFAYFQSGFEILSESVLNVSRTDSLGRANNISSYLYLGKRLSDRSIPYLVADLIDVSDDELHVAHLDKLFIGLGYRHEFNSQLNLKFQIMRLADIHLHPGQSASRGADTFSAKIQLAYVL